MGRLTSMGLGLVVTGLALLAGCDDVPREPASPPPAASGLELAFPGPRFHRPVTVVSANDGTGRVFVAERSGRVFVLSANPDAGAPALFLDLSPDVSPTSPEEGLLDLALSPHFRETGEVYAHFVALHPKRSLVARYRLDPDNPNRAVRETQEVLLEIEQPFDSQKGGQLAFGPDGLLYVGTGDGGGLGDPFGYAQDRASLLGKLLRVDAGAVSIRFNYAVPPANPWVGNTQGHREEVYAYGFRNLRHFCFDPTGPRLWAFDSGQEAVEEINLIRPGGNYGWSYMEGDRVRDPSRTRPKDLETPVATYDRTQGSAIAGGQVYHGRCFPDLKGALVYADGPTGRIWKLRHDGRRVTERALVKDTGIPLADVALDAAGELLFLGREGAVYRLAGCKP